jgi:hypothetical protein
MTLNYRRILLGTAGALLATGVAAGVSVAAAPHADTNTQDIVLHTNAAVTLSANGGDQTTVASTVLPANTGAWVITGTASVVNFGASDYARCGLSITGQPISGNTSVVGNPNAVGAHATGAAIVATITTSNFTITPASPVTVAFVCSHDNGNDQPYIDAGATLWLHRSAALATS